MKKDPCEHDHDLDASRNLQRNAVRLRVARVTRTMPLLSLPYTLEETCPIPWSTSAESQLHGDYPSADIKEETEQEFVIRRYLETLWLPEVRLSFSFIQKST